MSCEILTLKEYSEISNISARTIRWRILNQKMSAVSVLNKNNRKEYLIPLTSLSAQELKKYLSLKKLNSQDETYKDRIYETYTIEERQEIELWIRILKEWDTTRDKAGYQNLTAKAKAFISYIDIEFDIKTTYANFQKKYRAYKANDFNGLVDKRGKAKPEKKMHEEMWTYYKSLYLDERQLPQIQCYEFMRELIRKHNPELYEFIPSESSFRRRLKGLSEGEKLFGRYGQKAFKDKFLSYIMRDISEVKSNEIWVGDTHTIDVLFKQNNGKDKYIRLHFSAWTDMRSGIITGWNLAETSSSQSSVNALRDGIIRRGTIPEYIYVDNGREFLTLDFGGLGHRKRGKAKVSDSSTIEEYYDSEQFTILKRLGIEMINAIPKNAKAKTIERSFLTFKNRISRLFDSFTGGNILEKPEILKDRVKNGQVVIDSDFKLELESLIEYYFNYMPYQGSIKSDVGKKKIEVYEENKTKVRTANESELNLMLMRATKPQEIKRNGVFLDINGTRLWYCSQELKQLMNKVKVVIRFNPDDLSEVRLYNLDGSFLIAVPCVDTLVCKMHASSNDISEAMRMVRNEERIYRERIQAYRALGIESPLEIAHMIARDNEANKVAIRQPNVVEIVRQVDESSYMAKAVGNDCESIIDINRMNRNLKKFRENEGG